MIIGISLIFSLKKYMGCCLHNSFYTNMNSKIIGFTISRGEIDHTNIDIFHSNLEIKIKKVNNLFLYYWGIGNVDECIIGKNLFH